VLLELLNTPDRHKQYTMPSDDSDPEFNYSAEDDIFLISPCDCSYCKYSDECNSSTDEGSQCSWRSRSHILKEGSESEFIDEDWTGWKKSGNQKAAAIKPQLKTSACHEGWKLNFSHDLKI